MIHASARVEWAQARLMSWVTSLSLTGSPTIGSAGVAGRAAESGPRIRVTFDEVDPVWFGRGSATQTAHLMGLLMVCDVLWPESHLQGSPDLYGPDRAAGELRAEMQFLRLSFLDYTVPSAPVAVGDTTLEISRPATVRRLDADAGIRRRRVQATVEWIALFDDFNT